MYIGACGLSKYILGLFGTVRGIGSSELTNVGTFVQSPSPALIASNIILTQAIIVQFNSSAIH